MARYASQGHDQIPDATFEHTSDGGEVGLLRWVSARRLSIAGKIVSENDGQARLWLLHKTRTILGSS